MEATPSAPATLHGIQPIWPDAYHVLAPGNKAETKTFTYETAGNLPSASDGEVWYDLFDALCWYSNYFTPYHRETLLFAMAPLVKRLARSQDEFQRGMMAIFEELDSWKEKGYPIIHPEPQCEEDERSGCPLKDVVNYLYKVAYNGMRGRKRKPVLIDNRAAENATDSGEASLSADEIEELLNDKAITDEDIEILRLKSQKLSESEIGKKLNLSRDQVKRRISKIYKQFCERLNVKATPMGRASRKGKKLKAVRQ